MYIVCQTVLHKEMYTTVNSFYCFPENSFSNCVTVALIRGSLKI